MTRARLIAHYLPQFHPDPVNDRAWGAGFSEWTSLAGARPRFRGHRTPSLPGELGFYDLRLAETRSAQAALARAHGIEGFLYWHYWFAGERVLNRPFDEVLGSGEPDFPFCVAWANHDWTRAWTGRTADVLIRQTYPGDDDVRAHFALLEPAFHDPRYVTVDGRPLFYLFRPQDIPDLDATVERWRELAVASGLPGIFFVGRVDGYWDAAGAGRLASALDGVNDYSLGYVTERRDRGSVRSLGRALRARMHVPCVAQARYRDAVDSLPRLWNGSVDSFPTVLPGWDSTPRHGRRGFVLTGRTPELFGSMVRHGIDLVADRPADRRLVFVKSWNEWAEGNTMEPDRDDGRRYLEACAGAVASPTAVTGDQGGGTGDTPRRDSSSERR